MLQQDVSIRFYICSLLGVFFFFFSLLNKWYILRDLVHHRLYRKMDDSINNAFNLRVRVLLACCCVKT